MSFPFLQGSWHFKLEPTKAEEGFVPDFIHNFSMVINTQVSIPNPLWLSSSQAIEAKFTDFREVRKFCQEAHIIGSHATKALAARIRKLFLATTLEMHRDTPPSLQGQLRLKNAAAQKGHLHVS